MRKRGERIHTQIVLIWVNNNKAARGRAQHWWQIETHRHRRDWVSETSGTTLSLSLCSSLASSHKTQPSSLFHSQMTWHWFENVRTYITQTVRCRLGAMGTTTSMEQDNRMSKTTSHEHILQLHSHSIDSMDWHDVEVHSYFKKWAFQSTAITCLQLIRLASTESSKDGSTSKN